MGGEHRGGVTKRSDGRGADGLAARCAGALEPAFEALHRPTEERGFWYRDEQTYASMLFGVRGDRGVDPPGRRFPAFGLAGALRAHRLTGLGDLEKMRLAANWVARFIGDGRMDLDNLYYGGFWSLMEAAVTFEDESYVAAAKAALEHTAERFLASPNLDYGCAVLGASEYLLAGGDDPRIQALVTRKARQHADSINGRGIPATGDRRAAYHQRMMYSTWGLAGLARVAGHEDLGDAAGRLLRFVTEERMDDDAGLLWHGYWEPAARPGGRQAFYPYGQHLYYECHQCFYATAVELYRQATGDDRFDSAAERAVVWIFGGNRWGYDLTVLGVPGLAARLVTHGGKLEVWRNRWKGCYEVGAYLWTMACYRERLKTSRKIRRDLLQAIPADGSLPVGDYRGYSVDEYPAAD